MAHIGHGRIPSLDLPLFCLKRFAFLCLSLGLLPGAALAARVPGRGAEARPDLARRLAYRFEFGTAGRVHVSLETSSPASGTEFLELPSRWADARDLERAIDGLKITGSEVSLEPAGRASLLRLRAKPGTTMRLEYDLVQDWTGAFRDSERHHVLIRPELVEFNGENGLVAPRMDGGEAVQVTFDFVHVPAGQTVVTSFGTQTHQVMSGTWSEVANALFCSGAFSTRAITVMGGQVLLAVAGRWSFSEQELALKVRQILMAERTFWQTPPPPWYAVVLAPFELGTSGGGGSAFTHAFSLYLAPGEHLGVETESLLAHEAFHAWNPTELGSVADTQKLSWFVEGFTTYYQDVMLERSGLLDRSGYLKRLNATLRDYLISPGTTPGTSAEVLDDDDTRYRAPYLRGAMMALWLQAQIGFQTDGQASLDDLMRALLADGTQPLTEERIFSTAGRFVRQETVRRLRGFAEGVEGVPLPVSAGRCVRFEPQQVWTFALGVPTAEMSRGALLHDVDPESAAYRAGLRDGQTLLAWSLWQGDSEREVVLTVRAPEGGEAVRRIRFLPHGRLVTVPQAVLMGGCLPERMATAGALSGAP